MTLPSSVANRSWMLEQIRETAAMLQARQVRIGRLLVLSLSLLPGCQDLGATVAQQMRADTATAQEAVVTGRTEGTLEAQDQVVATDLLQLQGTWRTIRWETGETDWLLGDEAFREVALKIHWDVKGDIMTRYFRNDDPSEGVTMTLGLEPRNSPKQITIKRGSGQDQTTVPGIYQLRGDILMVCMSSKAHEQRP